MTLLGNTIGGKASFQLNLLHEKLFWYNGDVFPVCSSKWAETRTLTKIKRTLTVIGNRIWPPD